MPWASDRSSAMASCTSPRTSSIIASAPSGSSPTASPARRSLTASATRCCWAPSWRLRSSLRRSASPAATMRAREARQLFVGLAQLVEATPAARCRAARCGGRGRPGGRARTAPGRPPRRTVRRRRRRAQTMMPSSTRRGRSGATRSIERAEGARRAAAARCRVQVPPEGRPGRPPSAPCRRLGEGADGRRGARRRRARGGRPVPVHTWADVSCIDCPQRFDELQQQLVERDGAGEPGAPRAQRLVGRDAARRRRAGWHARTARRRAGWNASAAPAAATIDSRSSVRSLPLGLRPKAITATT